MNAEARSGTVLLLALLVMSGVLIVGASLGTVAVLNLRQARTVDDAISAFSAAESGAEQTLYQLRRAGVRPSELNAAATDGEDPVLTGPGMSNGSSWTRTLSSGETTIFASIPRDRTYDLVLWDPENPQNPSGIGSLSYEWDDACGGTSAIEVIAASWDPLAPGGVSASVAFHGDQPMQTFLQTPGGITDSGFDPTRSFRVRIRAKHCDIPNLAITAYSLGGGAGVQVPMPSRVTVNANGSFGSARQAVELRLPQLLPLSGVFDYVIFSQCSLLKGVSGAPCP